MVWQSVLKLKLPQPSRENVTELGLLQTSNYQLMLPGVIGSQLFGSAVRTRALDCLQCTIHLVASVHLPARRLAPQRAASLPLLNQGSCRKLQASFDDDDASARQLVCNSGYPERFTSPLMATRVQQRPS